MSYAPCYVSKEKYLGHVFRIQIETLLRAGFHDLARMSEGEFVGQIEGLQGMLPSIHVEPGQDIVPFLIVIPRGMIPVVWQWLTFKEEDGRRAQTDLTHVDFFPEVHGPPRDKPYLAGLVDDVNGIRGCNAQAAGYQAKGLGRSPLMVEEGLALLRLKPSLIKQGIIFCAGTRIGIPAGNAVPYFESRPEGPELLRGEKFWGGAEYLLPTCQSRLYFKAEPNHPWDGPA